MNLIQDAEGRQFTFNGDDKQTQVKDVSNQIVGQYFYDGSGARVKKHVPSTGETTIFVYDAGGSLAAEYSTQSNPEPKTSYLTTDHLGRPRVITDANGEVIARRDFMPFGEDLYLGIGNRTASLKYSSTTDDIKQKFTGYLKDNETGLDFAEARMYENRHGRFTAVDPLLASGNSIRPQSFNRYTYGLNNPIVMIDSDGLYPVYFLEKDGKITYSTVKRGNEWKRYTGATDTFISVADNSTKGKLVTVTRRSMIVIPTGLETNENARASAKNFNELDSRQKQLIASLASNSLQKGKLVAILAGGAVLTGTGAGFYLYAAGATTGALINLGIAGSEFAKRNPQSFQGFVDFLNKPTPQGLIVNIGGRGEVPNAINLNLDKLGNIPNFLQGNASNIQKVLESSQYNGQKIGQIVANNFTSVNMNWSQFAQGAFNVLDKGGKVRLNIHGSGNAEIITNQVVPALQNAGFSSINIFKNVVTAIR